VSKGNGVLPEGCEQVSIGDLCDLINGRAFKPKEWAESGLPIIRIQNLNNPDAKFNHFGGEYADKHLVRPGELLFAWSGTPGTSFGAHVWEGKEALLNQHIFRVLIQEKHLHKHFFRFAINHKLEELISKAHGGVGLRHVTKGKFEATEFHFRHSLSNAASWRKSRHCRSAVARRGRR
jgi:type I restriction enzyme S subunit